MFKLQKNPSKPFKIIQFTDVQVIDPHQQCCPGRLRDDEIEAFLDVNKNAFDLIRKIINKENPDWIIFTGDNVYGQFDKNGSAFRGFIDFVESFKIKWSYVNGNHDGEKIITFNDKQYDCGQGYDAQNKYVKHHTKYLMYKSGNKKMGFGNYAIELIENKKPIWSFIMMDSHGVQGYENPGINKYQIDWYEKTLKKIDKANTECKNLTFFHIPNTEFKIAAKKYYGNEIFKIKGVNKRGDFGESNEIDCCFPSENFFNKVKELGKTKGIFVGHDHVNNSSVEYEGVRLTYGLKTGYYDYHKKELQGATKILIDHDKFAIEHIFDKN